MKALSITIGGLIIVTLLILYLIGVGSSAESNPVTGEVPGMQVLKNGIPPIDASRPAVTETAAFSMG